MRVRSWKQILRRSRTGVPVCCSGYALQRSFCEPRQMWWVGRARQCARRSGPFATRIKVRKAVLTDCSSGKYSATSGDKSTRFVPARKRAAYLPRTPPFNVDKSYSGRRPFRCSFFSVVFFIMFSLAPRRLAGADYSDILTAIRVGDNQHPTGTRHSDGYESLFHT